MVLAAVLLVSGALPMSVQEPVSFAREVLPILSDRCFSCHGPDEAARESELRLDREAGALADLGGYAAIVPGDPDSSELIARITSPFVKERMPPHDSTLRLHDEEIALLIRWVAEGAQWERHWAFVPPESPPPPPVANLGWIRDPLDAFVLAQLEARALQPNEEADPAAWLRRVTLDLTGLPPTPSAYRAFLADPSESARARVVDELLASPRYGERMAWEWLSAARYADTDGYQADPTRQMWPWRDWLIEQLNANTPYDQLTRELLAGDLLPEASPEQRLASGFHRNHMVNGEGGRILEETRVENVFDRVETTGTVWLGLTFNCARCHDHKFDPLAQEEYYRFADFFNQISDSGRGGGRAAPNMAYLSPEQRARAAELDAAITRAEADRRAPNPELDAAQAQWESSWRTRLTEDSRLAEPSVLGAWFTIAPFRGAPGELFDTAFFPETDGFDSEDARWRLAPELKDGEVLSLPSEPGAHYFVRRIGAPSARQISLSLGSDDGIRVWLNGKEVLARKVQRAAAPDQELLDLELREGGNELKIKIVNTGGPGGIYFRRLGESVDGLPPAVLDLLATPPAARSAEQADRLRVAYRSRHDEGWNAAQRQIDSWTAERRMLRDSAPRVMIMDTLPAEQRRATRLLTRGGYDQPAGEPLSADTPAFLPPLRSRQDPHAAEPPAPPDRLDLANWLLDPEHPLTGRVTVNREWQRFFGRGLVPTPEDFGRQGTPPSHPALLDHLTRRFVDGGWDLKALHRAIVLSATYRQSAHAAPAAYQEDPDNVWLARGPRHRLAAWMLRDQALALAGLLNTATGGPGVRPYQPDGVWSEATFDTIRYQQDSGAALYRRSVYVFWRRIVGPTFLFDSAKRQICEVGRKETNTPLHALVTLNDPTFLEAGRKFAERAWRAAPDTPGRIRWAWFAATGREPNDMEVHIMQGREQRFRARYTKAPDEAVALLAVGDAAADPDLPAAELAALAVVCSTILNLDEVLCSP